MSNELAKFEGGLPMSAESLMQGLQSMSQEIQTGSGGLPFLKMKKGSDIWIYGPENIEVEPDSLWAVNPSTLEHGFICWVDAEVAGEVMVPFNQPAPSRADLPDYGKAWDSQLSVQMQCISGEDTGVTVVYKGTSLGARNAMKELINKLMVQLQQDPTNPIPCIVLEGDSYDHKKWGEIFTPVFIIQEWINLNTNPVAAALTEQADVEGPDNNNDGDDADDQAPAPKTKRRSKKAKATEEAAKQEDAPPTARRRRRSRS